MTATLPAPVREVFGRFVTTEYVTVDGRGQPIAWPVTPYYADGAPHVDVTTGLGYPKKARDAGADPRVALLFSDPTGSGLSSPPMVLVQGTADVDDRDLDANRRRYEEESRAKLPAVGDMMPPAFLRSLAWWYFTRIYVHVRPERVYVWEDRDAEPALYGAHLEEVRSGHNEEPEPGHADPEGGAEAWDARMDELGERHPTAALAFVAPDGFPFAVRVSVTCDRAARRVRLGDIPHGAPLEPGLACLTAHAHDERFTWQQNFQVRGDLVREGDGWTLVPHRLVGGWELPPGNRWTRHTGNLRKMVRFRRTARRELARREERS